MKRTIEQRVPVIAEIERRKAELEAEAAERARELKNMQDQLRDAVRKHAKASGQLERAERRVRELEGENRSNRERMSSLRRLKVQQDTKIKEKSAEED